MGNGKLHVFKVINTETKQVRLIKTEKRARALKFVCAPFEVSLPDGSEVADLMADGIAVETIPAPAP